MAKRKRLTVPGAVDLSGGGGDGPEMAPAMSPAMTPAMTTAPGLADPPALFAAPPIARVAGEGAATAALQEIAREVTAAREGGRLVLELPLDVVDADYLVRDRVQADPEEMEALMASIRFRGQQVPIEVTALPGGRYGLISGWRRLMALRRLSRTEPHLQKVLAILRRPDTAATAYLAMVEENELRVGLSYYERARIVLRTVEQGVFPDTATALARLFGPASKAKRSKIGSFFRIVQALDGVLRFPNHIPERLGLALSRALDRDTGLAVAIAESLEAEPALQSHHETGRLEAFLAPKPAPKPSPPRLPPFGTEQAPGVFVETGFGTITFRGPAVTAEFQMRLIGLLRDL